MAALQVSSMLSLTSSYKTRRTIIQATLNSPKIRISPVSFPRLSSRGLMEELSITADDCRLPKTTVPPPRRENNNNSDPMVIAKLYAVLEAVADRVEMHQNICEQRDNWNNLMLTSINALTLTASTMCGFAATNSVLRVSSVILYLAAAGFLAIMNTIQPSQLAEEQRNATRLFKKLYKEINTMICIGNPTSNDVNEAMEKVLALDKAYPLPLLGAMLEKYPSNVEPAVWWPEQKLEKQPKGGIFRNGNGWNKELEEEMRKIVGVLKRNDKQDYLKLGRKALQVHKMLAFSGPALAVLGALGSAFVCVNDNPVAIMVGVVSGALASIVNTMEHGGQVGMVFEMYRSNAGFFQLMEENIETNLSQRRENGELFEMKVALQLGRSLSELKNLADSSSSSSEEFGCKLF